MSPFLDVEFWLVKLLCDFHDPDISKQSISYTLERTMVTPTRFIAKHNLFAGGYNVTTSRIRVS